MICGFHSPSQTGKVSFYDLNGTQQSFLKMKNFRTDEKNSKSRNNRKVFEKLRKIFEKFFEKFFERCNLMGDVILSNTSLDPI